MRNNQHRTLGGVRYLRLISEIQVKLGEIKRIPGQLQQAVEQDGIPEFMRAITAGKFLHDFYTGLEDIFEKIVRETGEGVPNGESWHKELLNAMTLELEEVRPPVIDKHLSKELEQYLRFRHLFRNIYGDELQWSEMSELVERMPQVLEQAEECIDNFCDCLKHLIEY